MGPKKKFFCALGSIQYRKLLRKLTAHNGPREPPDPASQIAKNQGRFIHHIGPPAPASRTAHIGLASTESRGARLLSHFGGAYLPPVCFVCAPSAPLCLCCRRVMRAQVRFRSSRTAMCNVPQPSQVSSILSPSMNGLSPRWLVPVARMSPWCSV